ncbi:MAG: glycosyltransferase [Chitinivibrionales bacterium]|nr:glycosyltransferase [Chitinivibrionales bacterium]
MKIAFLGQALGTIRPPAESGSLSIWTHQVARQLAREHDVVVVSPARRLFGDCPQDDENVRYWFAPRYVNALGNRVARVAWQARVQPANRTLDPLFAYDGYDRGYAWTAARMLRSFDPDVVHTHNFSQFVPVVKQTLPRARVLLHMHCDWLAQLDCRRIAERIAHADGIIGVSDAVSDAIRERFPEFASKVATVYNGVALPESVPPTTVEGEPLVLWIGRISPEKGVHVLLDAFIRVARKQPRARLVLVGAEGRVPPQFLVDISSDPRVRALRQFYAGGSYTEHLRSRIPPDLQSRVQFAGPVAYSRMDEWLRKASVLVNASLSESFCMPVAEAMSWGVPVVATRVGGVPEVVGDGAGGILVAPDDPAALAEALIAILGDPDKARRLGGAGRERARSLFAWERVGKELLKVYAGERTGVMHVA